MECHIEVLQKALRRVPSFSLEDKNRTTVSSRFSVTVRMC